MQPSGLLRNMRNVVHNYTEVEIKVREATSNDPWGPSSSIMAEISDLTYQGMHLKLFLLLIGVFKTSQVHLFY